MTFQDLNINQAIIKAIEDKKYSKPTEVQTKVIPAVLNGKDLLGCAHTGSGKTAAFAIPMLQLLSEASSSWTDQGKIRALVLAPTRELAIQIGESFSSYGKYLDLKIGVIYGGITPKQHIKVLKREPHILIATPGRLLDLIEKGVADLSAVALFVLDEADQMLDQKMIQDVKAAISKLPSERQNMLFSATMPNEVMKIVNRLLKNPVKIVDRNESLESADIKQLVYCVEEPDKASLLLELLKGKAYESVLVFTRTKKRADKVSKALNVANIRSKAIHGDKNQSERLMALELFKNKEIKVLVATDVAARGIDIKDISLVVNLDIPNVPETFIHRIGRTGRAGKSGLAISFCSTEEKESLMNIEKLQGKSIEIVAR
ncbi:DEAD/DEAH box helicase [Fusibacter sp. 3D3]|uniref:DEAD/DEAH box helicase n=1 Tax=Fusibacter sp. 3D3 TaxID=1048380 RepID=UPI00085387E1|nr:DEAD/DEAH box helicase [Fusibacter sp. 3D3]GAU78575.1 ATP-dependent RNA helicase RhlE [Fusibacter sp. 3D3]